MCLGIRSHEFQDRRLPLTQLFEVAGFIVKCASFPAAVQNTNPFERQRSYRRLVLLAAVSEHIVVRFCPRTLSDGMRCEFMKRLSQEFVTGPTTMHVAALATLHCHRRDSAETLDFVGRTYSPTVANPGCAAAHRPWAVECNRFAVKAALTRPALLFAIKWSLGAVET